jgi:glycerol-3-phosphate O-acyltransferase
MAKTKRPPGARLFEFNDERAAIIAEVERRVMRSVSETDDRGTLEYLLNDAVFHEVARYEKIKTRQGRRNLARWLAVRRQLPKRDRNWIENQAWSLVRYHTNDIAGNFNPRVYSFSARILPFILASLLNAGQLDRKLRMFRGLRDRASVGGDIDRLRSLADKALLIHVPTHSSNLDSLVVGWALYDLGLPPVTYGAGKNLFSNPVFTFFMQNLGAYRVDRRLRFNLYNETLKAYSQVLLERGFHSLFFPGGTRARDNRIETRLKLGLLGTAFPAQVARLRRNLPTAPIVIVPSTLNYALVLEAESLINDYLTREGREHFILTDDESSRLGRITSFLFHLLRVDSSFHLHLGTPTDLFGNEVDADGVSRDPRGRPVDLASYFRIRGELREDPVRDREYTRLLGERLTQAYHRDNTVLPTHVVARCLFKRVRARFADEDPFRFLRRDGTLSVARSRIEEDVDRMRNVLRGFRDEGRLRLFETTDRASAAELVDTAIQIFSKHHTRPAIRREGDRLVASDLRLLLFYQNRLEGYRLEEFLPFIEPRSAGVLVGVPSDLDAAITMRDMPRRLRKIASSDEAGVPTEENVRRAKLAVPGKGGAHSATAADEEPEMATKEGAAE